MGISLYIMALYYFYYEFIWYLVIDHYFNFTLQK
jgi:hypothetical protein